MDRQVDRLTRIVEDVLEISRLNRGLMVLDPGHLDLRQLGRQAVEGRLADAERGRIDPDRRHAGRSGLGSGGQPDGSGASWMCCWATP